MSNVWPIYYARFRSIGIKRASHSEPLNQGCINVIILEVKVLKPIYYSEFVGLSQHENDFRGCEIESKEGVPLGGQVKYQNRSLAVTKIKTTLEKGLLLHRYTLMPKSSTIQSKESFEKAIQLYGSNIGDPATGTFVLPKSVVNKAIEASNGNPRILENLLGLDPGYLGEHPIILDINNISNIRIPSGNEAGAWPEYWIPGGYTSGGVPEAIVDQIPSGGYTISNAYPNQ
jgi:hypothetical protein